jgi:hypothetical protein
LRVLTLVFPHEANVDQQRVSVLAPLGTEFIVTTSGGISSAGTMCARSSSSSSCSTHVAAGIEIPQRGHKSPAL